MHEPKLKNAELQDSRDLATHLVVEGLSVAVGCEDGHTSSAFAIVENLSQRSTLKKMAAHMKNDHSSCVGCHCTKYKSSLHWESNIRVLTCSSRMAPGSTVTSAAAMVVETEKTVESTILTLPPLSCVAFILDMAKEKA